MDNLRGNKAKQAQWASSSHSHVAQAPSTVGKAATSAINSHKPRLDPPLKLCSLHQCPPHRPCTQAAEDGGRRCQQFLLGPKCSLAAPRDLRSGYQQKKRRLEKQAARRQETPAARQGFLWVQPGPHHRYNATHNERACRLRSKARSESGDDVTVLCGGATAAASVLLSQCRGASARDCLL